MKRVLSVIMIACLCVGLMGCGKKDIKSASDIFNEMKQEDSLSKYIKESKVYTKKNDSKLGKLNSYNSKVSWEDSRIETLEDDSYNGGSIELFDNEKDAKSKKEFVEYLNEQILDVFSEKVYGEHATLMHTSNKYVYQKGNAVIMLNIGLSEKSAKGYTDIFKDIIGDFEFKQSKVPNSEEIKNLSEGNKKEVDEKVAEAKAEWDRGLDTLATEMNEKVVNLQSSLSEFDLKDVDNNMKDFNIPYYAEKYNGWKEIVESARTTINNNKKEAAAKAEAERKAAAEQAEAERKASLGRQNALAKAHSYLRSSSFSYTRLIGQLDYEGFTNEQATYAVDHCGADWNEQAAKKAQSYMKSSSFSRQRLIEQLLYEGFSQDQAVYGVTSVGY